MIVMLWRKQERKDVTSNDVCRCQVEKSWACGGSFCGQPDCRPGKKEPQLRNHFHQVGL